MNPIQFVIILFTSYVIIESGFYTKISCIVNSMGGNPSELEILKTSNPHSYEASLYFDNDVL